MARKSWRGWIILASYRPDNRRNKMKTITGPRWIVEIDSLENNAIISADFHSREECFGFSHRNPGNYSLRFIRDGETVTYSMHHKVPDLKRSYEAWARQLTSYGSTE